MTFDQLLTSNQIQFYVGGTNPSPWGPPGSRPFTEPELIKIKGYLRTIYDNPGTRTLFDQAFSHGQPIRIAAFGDPTPGNAAWVQGVGNSASGTWMAINPVISEQWYYFNTLGKLVQADPLIDVLHELIHLATGKEDQQVGPSDATMNQFTFDYEVTSCAYSTITLALSRNRQDFKLRMARPLSPPTHVCPTFRSAVTIQMVSRLTSFASGTTSWPVEPSKQLTT